MSPSPKHSFNAVRLTTFLALWFGAAVWDGLGIARETAQIPGQLPAISIDRNGKDFVVKDSGKRFLVWGLNYDHDRDGKLLEDYWLEDWPTVEEDFSEMKALGANTVRIHLQLGKFMQSPSEPNLASLRQLEKLVRLAETTGLYLDITGLGCYHRADIPSWYDALSEQQRWNVQSAFWESVAQVGSKSSAIFCYDLMNEPIFPSGQEQATDWLAGDLGGKHFVQRVTLNLAGRSREQVAREWITKLVDAIRLHDQRTMITVGAIPWSMVWPNAKSILYSPLASEKLDFVSIHVYPEKDKVEQAIAAIDTFDIGKPIVIEEMFPLKCDTKELGRFVELSRDRCDGWVGFYWGATLEELKRDPKNIGQAITRNALEWFHSNASRISTGSTSE